MGENADGMCAELASQGKESYIEYVLNILRIHRHQ